MPDRRVTLELNHDRIGVHPSEREIKKGDTVVWNVIGARPDDTVEIGGFKEVKEEDFDPNPTVLAKGRNPFPRNGYGPRKGPGSIPSDPAEVEEGRYKYWVKWHTKFVDGDTTVEKTITKDPWIWLR